MASLLLNGLIWVLAGFVSGITSFGGNMVAVPILMLFIPPQLAILTGCIAGTTIAIYLGWLYRRDIQWKEILTLAAFTMIGMPAGVRLLKFASPSMLLFLAATAILLFLLCQFFAPGLKNSKTAVSLWAALPLGICSGILYASVSMGGPPLVIYGILRKWTMRNAMANMSTSSVISIVVAMLPDMYLNGLLTPEALLYAGVGSLFCGIGVLLSIPVFSKINEHMFRRLLIGMLVFADIMMFVRAFAG